MTWIRLLFEPGMKTHVVPASMHQLVLAELVQRGAKPFEPHTRPGLDVIEFAPIKACTEWYIDFGGMIHKDEPSIEIDTLDGLKVGARADHVDLLVMQMKKLRREGGPRFLSDGRSYRKVYEWLSCLVVTSSQFDQLLASAERVAPEAERRAKEFHDELDRKWKEQA